MLKLKLMTYHTNVQLKPVWSLFFVLWDKLALEATFWVINAHLDNTLIQAQTLLDNLLQTVHLAMQIIIVHTGELITLSSTIPLPIV